MKHRSLGPGEMGVFLLVAFSAIAGALTWAHSTPPPVPEGVAARSDTIEALRRRDSLLRDSIAELNRRADSLTEAYEGVPRWDR